MKKGTAIGGLVLVTLIWGGGFIASDMALESLGPFQIMMLRFLLASILMGIGSIKVLKTIKKEEIIAGSLMGVALFTAFALQIVGLQYTTPSKNAFLTSLNVVMVPFIAFIILKKKIGFKGILGAVLSVIGVAVLSLQGDFSLGLGDTLTLICAIGFAFQIFLTSQFVQKYRVPVLNCVQMTVSFILSFIGMFIFHETHFQITTKGTLSVIYLGAVSTAICYLIQTVCQKYVDETKAAIILSMEAVFGTVFSVIILHEVITLRMVIGSMIILTAVIISNLSETSESQKLEEEK